MKNIEKPNIRMKIIVKKLQYQKFSRYFSPFKISLFVRFAKSFAVNSLVHFINQNFIAQIYINLFSLINWAI